MDFQQKVQISLTVLLTGLVVVFLMLIFLTLIIKGYGTAVNSIQLKLEQKHSNKNGTVPEKAEVLQETAEAGTLPAAETGIPEEIIAAVTAAAYCTCPGCTVTSVRRLARQSRSAWNAAGLLENTRPF